MDTRELFEAIDQSLSGYLNIPGLASQLPDISDPGMFDEAIDKIRLGHGSYLTIPEKMQLALAFISLVGLDIQQKMQVMRMLSASRAVPLPRQQQAQQASQTRPQA